MSITFTTLAIPPLWEKEARLLVSSLRTFGGALAGSRVVVLTLKSKPLLENIKEQLHMHAKYPTAGRIQQINDLVSARFENTKILAEFLSTLEISDKQSKWLEETLSELGGE